ncbi:ricin-type beta-trefoil lectin domain protein [Streptomyces vinaceus]|uniref:ricin-type beta-trefoil lectin domain protein n=1 Tax=Streptomyces vinaceus TaxID=1960 RepID=UPI00369BB722
MKTKRLASITLTLVAAMATTMSPNAIAADGNTDSWVWSRSTEAPVPAPLGTKYKADPESSRRSSSSQSKELPRPAIPTPEHEAAATEQGGSHYLSDGSPKTAFRAAATPDFAACNADPAGHAPSKAGNVKNHFEFCRWGFNTLTKLNGQGTVEGQVTFKETEVGEGSNSKRAGIIHTKITDLKVTGVFVGASMTMSPSATGYPGSCGTSFGPASTTYTAPLATWNGLQLDYEVSGLAYSGDQSRPDKPLFCNFQSNWKVEGPKAGSDWYRGPDQGMRMDSAAYLSVFGKGGEGAIFNRAGAWFAYDYNDASVKQVAEHIFSAYVNPASTDPRIEPAKKIPGWRGTSTELTRNWPGFNSAAQQVADLNESAKNAACRKITKGNPDYECDEFPFASTVEGAGSGDNFSVRYVPKTANRSAGGKLSSWYAQDRILHGDKFQVSIENHGKIVPGSLISIHSQKALDVAGWAPGALAQTWDYWGGPNQDFTFNDDNELRIFGNQCLDGGAGTRGTQVTSQPCSGAASQKWVGGVNIPTSAPMIFHVPSGLCLDVTGWGTENGTPVSLWDCNGGANQKWTTRG